MQCSAALQHWSNFNLLFTETIDKSAISQTDSKRFTFNTVYRIWTECPCFNEPLFYRELFLSICLLNFYNDGVGISLSVLSFDDKSLVVIACVRLVLLLQWYNVTQQWHQIFSFSLIIVDWTRLPLSFATRAGRWDWGSFLNSSKCTWRGVLIWWPG